MGRCVNLLTCLLLSFSAGFGTYALGAIIWCIADPADVGARLLFTIPIALAGMTIPGIIGALCWTFRCDLIGEARPTTTHAPRVVPAPAAHVEHADDIELALAT